MTCHIAIRLKIQTKSSHKIHRAELLRLDFVNLNSWIAIVYPEIVKHCLHAVSMPPLRCAFFGKQFFGDVHITSLII